MTAPLLEMVDMSVHLPLGNQTATIVSDLTLSLNRGERLGIVGESGSGKTMAALALMGLLPERMRIRGDLRFDGMDLTKTSEESFCKLRGRRIAMIFQEPMTALNPVKTIGAQIAEGRRLHLGENRTDAEKNARLLLDRVGLTAPRFDLGLYPHQLSGGQRQRVMIAIAIACKPDLLIADEPTTALDVTLQAQILDLLNELIAETGAALILISHDLGVVSEMSDRVAIMYAGRIVEIAPTKTVFQHMAHPYTRALFAASPNMATIARDSNGKRQRLAAIPGIVPDPLHRPFHCHYADRCTFVQNDCRDAMPLLAPVGEDAKDHRAACFHPRGIKVSG